MARSDQQAPYLVFGQAGTLSIGDARPMRPFLLLLVGSLLTSPGLAAESDLTPGTGPKWCPPDGPRLPNRLSEGQHSLLKPGWVTLRMHVRPGAVPVRDVRVVSEAGGPMHARTLIPLVRQWIGCASNERDTIVDMKFAFWLEGSSQLPQKEGFSPLAFKEPRGAPQLPAGDWGIGVCPIRATLLLRQPEAPNVVNEIESGGGAPVRAWLESLVPDREYMTPSPTGNRVEFDCRVDGAKVTFSER